MKNNVFKVTAGNKFQAVILFLRGQLGIKQSDSLVRIPCWNLHAVYLPPTLNACTDMQFTYINGAFAPTPDDTVGSLYKCFGTEGHLIVNYR